MRLSRIAAKHASALAAACMDSSASIRSLLQFNSYTLSDPGCVRIAAVYAHSSGKSLSLNDFADRLLSGVQ
jgi:hypothetical protein